MLMIPAAVQLGAFTMAMNTDAELGVPRYCVPKNFQILVSSKDVEFMDQ